MRGDFQIKELHELVEIRVSGVDKKIYADEIQVKLCNYMDVYNNPVISSTLSFSDGSVNASEKERFSLEKGDVIITKDSETPEDIAVSSYVSEDINHLVCGYHLAILKPSPEIDGLFLMYKLKLPQVQKSFFKIASGSTRYGLTISGIQRVNISFPPLPQQRKIAKILSTSDRVIERTEAAIAKYEAIKQGMMHDLFTRGIDTQTGKLRPTREQAPELYKESPLGWIPREWEVKRLGEMIEAIDPQPDHRTPAEVENGIPYLGINDIDELGNIKLKRCRKVSAEILAEHIKRYQVEDGDIIFGKIGTIGEPKRLFNFKGATLSANIILIKPKETSAFVFWYLKSHSIASQIKNSIHTTSQPAFGIEKIRTLIIPDIPKEEQILISDRLNSINTNIQKEQSYLKKHQQLKTALMQDLLTGKVGVE